ncbi:MAG: hypothetical protein WC179_01285 [Candidatus Cloacimonadaceae bacterium]|jgi:hypothetical protein|nr:hypothetical protein [Candidatus Syntrophosphaera sp.]
MKKGCLFLLLLVIGFLFAQPIEFPQPQFINPIFDSFTRNYVSTSAMGRGYTGITIPGGVDNALLNPAAYLPDKAALHLELLAKPSIRVDFYAAQDTSTGYNMTANDRLTSPVPFGIFAVGSSLGDHFSYGFLYSMPKTVRMDDFSIATNMGLSLILRYPTFNLHQITANAAFHHNQFHLGVNLHNQFYYLGDVTFLRTFDRVRDTKYILRPQFGFLYTGNNLNAGFTLTPPQNVIWDLSYVEYDTKLPLNLSGGLAYKNNGTQLAAEIEYEQCSAIYDEFKDRYTFHLGAEKRINQFTYRLGYIYHPEVWHGDYLLPDAAADTVSIWWDKILPGGTVNQNTQHILTGGFSWHHKDVNVNLAGLVNVANTAPISQISLSIDLYFSAFKRKDFLYFGK